MEQFSQCGTEAGFSICGGYRPCNVSPQAASRITREKELTSHLPVGAVVTAPRDHPRNPDSRSCAVIDPPTRVPIARQECSPREQPQQNHVKRPDGNGKRQLEFDHAIPVPKIQKRGGHDIEIRRHWRHQRAAGSGGERNDRRHCRIDPKGPDDQRHQHSCRNHRERGEGISHDDR